MSRLVRFGFQLLYTRFAYLYDRVADAASFGEWQTWIETVLGHVRGRRVLELAHGPGHLQVALKQRGYGTIGIDLSAQMGRIAMRRLTAAGLRGALVRADVRGLPFPSQYFNTVVSTFPTEFIRASGTLDEAHRVLINGGRLVVVPHAELKATTLTTRSVRWAYQVTGQRAPDVEHMRSLFEGAGFDFKAYVESSQRADVIIWIGERRRD